MTSVNMCWEVRDIADAKFAVISFYLAISSQLFAEDFAAEQESWRLTEVVAEWLRRTYCKQAVAAQQQTEMHLVPSNHAEFADKFNPNFVVLVERA